MSYMRILADIRDASAAGNSEEDAEHPGFLPPDTFTTSQAIHKHVASWCDA